MIEYSKCTVVAIDDATVYTELLGVSEVCVFSLKESFLENILTNYFK